MMVTAAEISYGSEEESLLRKQEKKAKKRESLVPVWRVIERESCLIVSRCRFLTRFVSLIRELLMSVSIIPTQVNTYSH